MNSTMKQVITWVVLAIAAVVLWQVVANGAKGPKEKPVSLTQFMNDVDQGVVQEATIRGAEVTGKAGHAGSHLAGPQQQANDAQPPPFHRERAPERIQRRFRCAIETRVRYR